MKFKSLILFFLLFISGCAYFNTFYNAEKLFKEAREIPLNDKGKPKATAVQKYNKTIKKCGIILTDYQDSKWADDALFLLAQSLFYKGNSYIQAIEQFEDLILLYPKSEFVPSAHLYIAQSKFEFNQKKEAYKLLGDFINNPKFKDDHPRALQILANYHLEDDNLVQANHVLERIITDFPKSDEFEQAYFLQGKTLHIDKKYEESIAVFTNLTKSRISKKIKLDSRYYITLNHLEIEEYDEALNKVEKLIDDEYRLDRISDLEIVKARALVGKGNTDEAIEIFTNVIENNKRTRIAADASFYLAETYFRKVGDYEQAIEYYNLVKTSFSNSEFVEPALNRSAVASQIIQFNNPDTSIPTETLIEQQFKLAEFYNEVLDHPDSSLIIYDRIIANEVILPSLIDSLENLHQNNLAEFTDSTASEIAEEVLTDSSFHDSLIVEADEDSLINSEIDSLSVISKVKRDSILIDSVKIDLENYIEKNKADLSLYTETYIPFARFIKIWLLHNTFNDTLAADSTYQILESKSPDNEYTLAAKRLLADLPLEIENLDRKRLDKEYETAIDLLEVNPDSAVVLLSEIANQIDNPHYWKANFALGNYLFFEKGDTISTKTFFNHVLESEDNELISEIDKYYDGTNFLFYERFDKIIELEQEIESEEESTTSDSEDTNTTLEEEINTEKRSERNIERPPLDHQQERERSTDIKPSIELLSESVISIPSRFKEYPEIVSVRVDFLPDKLPGKITILDQQIIEGTPLENLIVNTVRRWKYKVPDLELLSERSIVIEVFLNSQAQ